MMLLRSVIIVALLASLFYLVRHFQPAAEPGNGRVATSQPEKPLPETAEGEAISGFNPPVTMPLPDVEKGYVFSEKRKIEKEEPGAAAKAAAAVEQGPDPLETVVYSGSLIAGKIRRALVSYQEQAKEAPSRRPSPGRGQAPAAVGAVQNKQLNQGDRFLGYVLTVVESDRIVFEKGERKVEKFLYDRSKKRAAPPETGRKEAPAPQPAEVGGVPLQALAPPEVIEALMAPPGSRRPSGAVVGGAPGSEAAGEAGGTPGGVGATQAPTPASRATRRSQRLLGLDSSIRVPATPVPGRPVPNK